MFMLLAVLIPSVIGIWFIESQIGSENISKKQYVYLFLFLLLLSTIMNNIFAYALFGVDSQVLEFLNTLTIFFVKYVLLSILINIIISFIIVIFMKNVSINIEVIKNEAKKTKKNKKNDK
ncbi:MAG: hypothetical protein IKE75_06290 [Bacilli bacterium]|nr:hypothetical protein [Bacilli bacterium]